MLVKDLIKLLEDKVRQHESNPEYYKMMGELGIYVDVFEERDEEHTFHYAGYDTEIKIEVDPTNGQLIINAFAPEKT